LLVLGCGRARGAEDVTELTLASADAAPVAVLDAEAAKPPPPEPPKRDDLDDVKIAECREVLALFVRCINAQGQAPLPAAKELRELFRGVPDDPEARKAIAEACNAMMNMVRQTGGLGGCP
jgi:hypothetical protein